MEDAQEQLIQQLRQEIEATVERKMQTPKDFDFLSEHILQVTTQRVSATTLKRIWGYANSGGTMPRQSTLDILAQLIQHDSWADFCQQEKQESTPPSKEGGRLNENSASAKSNHPSPSLWAVAAVVAVLLAVVAGTHFFSHSATPPTPQSIPDSPLVITKGQRFATYQDYLRLFGIHAKDTLWGQRLPHHPEISIWGPRYHHRNWHNDGDSLLLLPTITERWEPSDGYADSALIAMRNHDHYYTYRDMNELRITFMRGLTPDGDSLTFLGVYRMDLENSNTHHITWVRVAEEVDLSRLDYLEELRN